MISNFQFERLEYIIDSLKLDYYELMMVDRFLADPDMDDKLDWLINSLRNSHYL